ncbi:uncharacterized protein LOC129595969 [Paramacrobiotus metropolitanus]|uniref:uncharacterized protein LOC129595969 n=1 Tax=Paramacrobiotus metropolitanus TaxID=2943436 RepID=UPI0024457858|nr:uncharacterized protein LOC129595969 [Paramacrobiotus metropolitanus]
MDIPAHISLARLQVASADLAETVWTLIAESVEWRVTGEEVRRAAEWVAWIKANRAQLHLKKHSRRYWEGTMMKMLCQTLCGLQALGLDGSPGLGGCRCKDAVFRQPLSLSQLSPLALGCVVQCAEEWELRCKGRLWFGKTDERAFFRTLVETRAWRP